MNRFNAAAIMVAMAAIVIAPAGAQKAGQAQALLEAARQKETLEGDLASAIKQYQAIVDRYRKADRLVAATALVHMAECYQKMGDAQARTVYARVIRDFSDQKDAVAIARARLNQQAAADPSRGISTRQVWTGLEVTTYGAPSPDGRFLTHIDWGPPALAIRDLATGTTRRVIDGSWEEPPNFPVGPSRFSPDGRHVVSLWFNEKGFDDLRVAPVAGGASRVLYSNAEVDPYPAEWSPDGTSILATFYRKDRTTQMALVSTGDGSAKVLKSFDWRAPGTMSFSPDGRYIAYDFPPNVDGAERDIDIFVVATDGSREVPLVQHPAADKVLGWAPDGKHILFSSDRTGTLDAWLIEVTEGRPNGPPHVIKRDIGRIQPMGFARSGSFYYGLAAGIRDIHVARLDPATGRILQQPQLASQRFVGANRGAEWSPDGERMAYFVNLSNAGRQPTSISIRSLKTGQERELIGSLRPNLNIRPRWSPDGRWLLVHSRDGRGRQGLYRVDTQTGAASQIVPDALWGVWTPDTRSIIYAREEEKSGVIRIRNLETGEDRELFRPEQPMFVSNLALSPDGRRLAFGMSTLSTIIAQVLTVLPLDGGRPRELWRGREQFAGLNWAHDGTQLFFAKGGEMWRVPTEGGQPEPLGLHPNGSDGFALHPDGRVAFMTGERKEEVWALENFLPAPSAKR